MKVKLKLDTDQLKQFALAHVEKGVFGVLALVALVLMFKSMGLPKFEKRPDDLQSLTSRAQQTVRTPEGEARELVRTELKPKEFLAIANKNTEKFLVDGYAWNTIKPQPYVAGGKRQEPLFLVVEDLHALADRGVFATRGPGFSSAEEETSEATPDASADATADKDAATPRDNARNTENAAGRRDQPEPARTGMGMGSRVKSASGEGFSYVVVTGKIPYAKQQKSYKEALGTAEFRLPTDSTPEYLAVNVERAEVNPGVADKDLKWVKISGSNDPSQLTKSRLNPTGESYCDPRFEHPLLTERLYGLTTGEWNPEIVAPEEFRIQEAEAPAAVAAAPAAADPVAGDGIAPEIRPDGLRPAAAAGARPGQAAPRRFGGGALATQGRMGGGMRMNGGGMGRGNRAPAAKFGNAGTEPPDKLLFRYFDFSAEPGKRYRYRARLFLSNPNLNVEPRYLETAALGQKYYRYTDQSDPSDPVTVPNDGALIAGTYTPPLGPNEASATVVLTQFMPQGGMTAVVELTRLFRGQMANEESSEAMILDPETGELQPAYEPVKFRNNLIMLDVTPAERNKPADVLVLNAEGKLVVLSGESEQERFSDILTKLRTKPKAVERDNNPPRRRDNKPANSNTNPFGR